MRVDPLELPSDSDLGSLARELRHAPGRLEGTNYTVSLGLFVAPGYGDASLAEIVARAVGPECRIASFEPTTAGDVQVTVGRALSRDEAGCDELDTDGVIPGWAGPLLARLATVTAGARTAWAFRFGEGHPYYPVFWEFAFALVVGDDGVVLVGSASD